MTLELQTVQTFAIVILTLLICWQSAQHYKLTQTVDKLQSLVGIYREDFIRLSLKCHREFEKLEQQDKLIESKIRNK